MLKKLSSKLITYFICLISLLVIVIFLTVQNLVKTRHINLMLNEMVRYSDIINLSISEVFLKNKNKEVAILINDFAKAANVRITLINMDGTVTFDSDVSDVSSLENHYYRQEVYQAIHNGSGNSIRYSSTVKTDMLYYAKLYDKYVLRLAIPLYTLNESLSELRMLIIKIAAGVFFIAVIIVVVVILKITGPFKETLSFAENFSKGDYKKRILNYTDDEIGSLQRALNKMADTIVETIEAHIFEKKKLETTLESISDGIALIDASKKILIWNKTFTFYIGIESDPKDRPFFEVIRNRLLNSKLEKALVSGESDAFEIELLNEKVFDVIINPIKEDNQLLKGVLLVLHDISEKKKIEKIKSDLVTNVSHELKTPIAIVKGYLETIKENPDNKSMLNDFIDRALENVDRQNALIQDIIKLSMIESSKEFEKEEVNIRRIILNCLDILTPKISKKGIALHTDFPEINYYTVANDFLAEEIFFNIIDNAINYNNPGGTIKVSARLNNNRLSVSISDSGIGIPQEYIDRIFERFYRVDKSRSRTTGGTGLGLSIVKHAAMVLGWNISVDSDKKGTTFTILI
ncbi:MAG: HAMP domain-containing protein [Spirochaetes bacterium]|nr:HAMP domain-containing protein [Spirochaetota bacterium]